MPKLRDGVIQRGGSWSYVIRVPDPATGVSKPRWVGGFATEEDAKAARDEARVRARRGEYVNRSTSTVAAYLAEWGGGPRLDRQAQDARGVPPRHRAPYRAPATGRDLQAVSRPGRARRPGRPALGRHDRFPQPPYAASVSKAPTRAAGPAPSASTAKPSPSRASTAASKQRKASPPDRPGATAAASSLSAGGANRSTPTRSARS
jgi:hypothetical protein